MTPRRSLSPATGVKRVNLALSEIEIDHDVAHLANIRRCPCLHCGMVPAYEAAHLQMASGLNKKPPAKWALPLCADHHRVLKNCELDQSEAAFWHSLGINPPITCEQLYARRGDLVAMRAVIFVAIAQRSVK